MVHSMYLRCFFQFLADLVLYVAFHNGRVPGSYIQFLTIMRIRRQRLLEELRQDIKQLLTHTTIAIMIMDQPLIQVEGGGTGYSLHHRGEKKKKILVI